MKSFKVRKQRPKRNYAKFMVWVMAGIMLLSSVGFLMSQRPQTTSTVQYGDYVIRVTQEGLVLELGRERRFTYYPDTVADLAPEEGVQLLQNARALSVTYDPGVSNPQAYGGVQYQLEQDFDKIVVRGLTNKSTHPLPVITCTNATRQQPVITFREGNTTGYHLEGHCLIGTASTASGVVQLRDALLYAYHGVLS